MLSRCDVIVRFNCAPIQDYEAHVGSRTTFIFVNGKKKVRRRMQPKECKADVGLLRMWDSKLIKQPGFWVDFFMYGVRIQGNARSCERMFRREGGSSSKKLSTGLCACLIFRNVAKELHLYGFGSNSGQDHYYEVRPGTNRTAHSFSSEKEFWKNWSDRDSGVILHE